MTRKPTQYPKIIRELKNYMNNDSLTITLSFGKKCLTETLYVSGDWEGNSYSISADINWRSGELKTTEMNVFELCTKVPPTITFASSNYSASFASVYVTPPT